MTNEGALRERVKELECLYEVSRILRNTDASLEEMLRGIVEALPGAFQYPELAGARIRAGALTVQTAGFVEGPFVLSADLREEGESAGTLEVSYPPDISSRETHPFLPEEEHLVEKIAGEIELAVAKIRTAGENTRLERQLRHADRLATIGVLTAGIAHELNEPLAMILGFAQLVEKTQDLPGAARKDLSRIVDAALHARDIVQKLLSFGQAAHADAEADCDMDATVTSVLDFLEPRCRAEEIEVAWELAGKGAHVGVTPIELRQVLVNLAVNAIQATPRGGRLTVRTERSGGSCLLTVEDTGSGMTRDVQDRIFIPFFTTKKEGRGTGLGLPVIHGIVMSRGGTISVTSKPGAGSRFVVTLATAPA